jgi:F-type H+-transporting ATPase subunit gamma
MEAVSIAKLKKSRDILSNIREYIAEINEIIKAVSDGITPEMLDNLPSEQEKKIKNFLGINTKNTSKILVICSPDRGLCGSLNSNLEKQVHKKINEMRQGCELKIIGIGKKISNFITTKYPELMLKEPSFQNISSGKITQEQVKNIVTQITKMHVYEGFNSTDFMYIYFENPIIQTIKTTNILPYKSQKNDKNFTDYLYEPDPLTMLEMLLEDNIKMSIWLLINETLASEYAARIIAMKNATDNAKKAIKQLNLQYNRTRQANITRELIDIVSGKEAL